MCEYVNYQKARQRVEDELGLPSPHPYSQDWEFEIPWEFKTREWAEKYLAACARPDYGRDEKNIVMSILVDTLNNALWDGEDWAEELWPRVRALLVEHAEMFRSLIEYWSSEDTPLEDAWAVAEWMRELRGQG